MSEFTNHKQQRVEKLVQLFQDVLKGVNPGNLYSEYNEIIGACIPSDIVSAVHRLVEMEIPISDLKKAINKTLNLLYKNISNHPYSAPGEKCFLGCLVENNRVLDEKLQKIRPLIREINSGNESQEIKRDLLSRFTEVEKISNYYLIKENILFPVIEKYIPEFRCLSVMWSFHDDIRQNLKLITAQLTSADFDLKVFNRLAGDLFFNIYAVKFREERILYPAIQEVIPEPELNALFTESREIGFPFHQPEIVPENNQSNSKASDLIDLETGDLTVEQIKLLFNHLPVDITFVDENDKVVYFSSPKKRIFPRSKAIIGRDVHNCHPPESVHVVHQIIEAFRKREKDVASFWINMKGMKLLIQYFAIRNKTGEYKGVVEVSQEISEIQNLQGEKRLLDWENKN